MHLIQPFAALRPAPGRAAEVVAPPYDVLSTEEARALAADRPWSFLHISKPEIDLPSDTDPYSPQVYAQAAFNLRRMLERDVLRRDDAPRYYVYRLTTGGHVQTGLVVAAAVADYDRNRIRKHELTRPDKEDDRVRQIEALDAQTGPVLLAYPAAPHVDEIAASACATRPEADVVAADGVRHTIWTLSQPNVIQRLTAAFDAMPALYIADGHHRSAAASRVAAARRAAGRSSGRAPGAEYFLAVAFPHHQMRILSYNRVVRDLRGASALEFLLRVGANFSVQKSDRPVQPAQHGEFGMYMRGSWYRLQIKPALAQAEDPVRRLDVSVLTEHLLTSVLKIEDPRTDKRIDFVGGGRGLAELQRRVDSGEMAAAFSLFPTRMEDLMAVADAGQIMPPKSTWFEPKLADGLVSHVLD